MTIKDFFSKTELENSFIIGYYGGSNFGDELLLEVILNILKKQKFKKISFYYSNPELYSQYHHDFGYRKVNATPISILVEMFRCSSVVIGGGGLWGLDFNKNIGLLSLLLFFCKYFLRKDVYLIGVGYYKSTTFMGHMGAFLAACAAKHVIARDNETYNNFFKYSNRVSLDKDISFYISEYVDFGDYESEALSVVKKLGLNEKRVLVGVRRFQSKYRNEYYDHIKSLIKIHNNILFSLVVFESKNVSKELFLDIKGQEEILSNVNSFEYDFNPLAFFFAIQIARKNIRIVAPQYHVQITAFCTGTPFFALDYDDKNKELFKMIGCRDFVSINRLSVKGISQIFLKNE